MIINSCSLFSHPYTKPNLDIPNKWNELDINLNTNNITKSESLAQMQWWQQFNDPNLDQIIKSALAHNNDIKISMTNLANAQVQLKQVNLSWIPTVPLLLGFSQMPVLNNPSYFLGLFPSYTLNIFSQIQAQNQAKYQFEALKYTVNSVRLTIIGQTAGSYFTLSSQHRQLQLTQDLLKIYQQQEMAYQKQYELGLANVKIISDTSSNIMQVEAQIALLQNNIIISQNALRYLTNQNPGKINLATNFNHLNANVIVPGSLPVTVLANRPDVQAAEEQLKARNAEIGLAYSNLLPSLQIDAFLAQTTSNLNNNNSRSVNMTEAYASVPLLNPKIYEQIDSNKALYSKDYYTYEQTVRKALRDVENDLSAHKLYVKRYDDFKHVQLSLEQGCNNDLIQFQNGLINYTAVLECQINLNQANILLVQSKLDKLVAIVALYQDLGGGYSTQPASK